MIPSSYTIKATLALIILGWIVLATLSHTDYFIGKMVNKAEQNQNYNSTTSLTPQSIEQPIAVLHIGPHKTGTSSIQCDLTHYQDDLLGKASIAYLGRTYSPCISNKIHNNVSSSFKAHELISNNPSQIQSIWNQLDAKLRYFSKQKISVVLSDEVFARNIASDSTNNDMRHELYNLCSRYYPGQVHVVVMYRRYYEWMLSRWNQGNKPYDNTNYQYREIYRKWPSEGGQASQTFPSYMSKKMSPRKGGLDSYTLADRNKFM